jgi:hypothetical protein
MRTKIPIIVAIILFVIIIVIWESRSGQLSLDGQVTTIAEGYWYARRLLPAGDSDAPLIGIVIGVSPPLSVPRVNDLNYFFTSRTYGQSYGVIIKNAALTAELVTYEVPEWLRKQDPYRVSPIDIESVRVGIVQALALTAEQAGEPFGKFGPGDLQIDMNLGNSSEGLVWKVSYDAWTVEGPQGVADVVIDARTG